MAKYYKKNAQHAVNISLGICAHAQEPVDHI